MEISDILQKVYDLEGMLHVKDRLGEGAPLLVNESMLRLADEIAADVAELVGDSAISDTALEEPAVELESETSSAEPEPEAAPSEPEPEPDPVPEQESPAENDFDQPRRDYDDEPARNWNFHYTEPEKRAPEPTEAPEAPAATQPPQIPQEPAAPQPEPTRNILRAFTINDRFRFRRALFHGSDDAMNAALAAVQGMDSVAEAEDYFYNELHWDSEDADAAEFMAIVARVLK